MDGALVAERLIGATLMFWNRVIDLCEATNMRFINDSLAPWGIEAIDMRDVNFSDNRVGTMASTISLIDGTARSRRTRYSNMGRPSTGKSTLPGSLLDVMRASIVATIFIAVEKY